MQKLLIFNKPYNVLSQFSGEVGILTLRDYIKMPGFYPAGRLDKDSEGLLLLTNDGALQHRLAHPKFQKKKKYWVQVEGRPEEDELEPLRVGLLLKTTRFLPATVSIIEEPTIWPRTPPIRFRKSIPTTWLNMEIMEGKNHQIRRMTAAIGFPTLRLIRYQIADWSLNGLLPGEYLFVDKP